MLKNYIKIAWRNLYKHKVFSLINIFGLSIGIAFSLLIGSYVWSELHINHGLNDTGNQYIILDKWKDPNMGDDVDDIAALPQALADNYPELIKSYYHSNRTTTTVSKGDKHYSERIQIGDSTILKMYGFTLLYGNNKTALNDPFSVVITHSIALKYFGKDDVTGQTLNFENSNGEKHDFIITGVLSQVPQNSVTGIDESHISDFFFTAAASKYFGRGNMNGWINVGTTGFLDLKDGVEPKRVEKAMADLIHKYEPDDVLRTSLTPYLVKLNDYNLTADGGLIKKMTWTLSCISLFILLMAVINFVNICIGRSSGRMKEMGIRKVLGGLRKQLIWQFLVESIMTAILSTLLALVFYTLLRPYFSIVLGKDIMDVFSIPLYIIPIPFLLALLIGAIAGIYPALILSALKSIDSLKGKLKVKDDVIFRKLLVAFQFTTAAIVFIGAVIISQQIDLFFKSNLGYNKNYIIYAPLPKDYSPKGINKMETIRDQFSQLPQVSNISLSYEIPNGSDSGNPVAYREGSNPAQSTPIESLSTDNQFALTYNIKLKAGTFFKPLYNVADSTQIVINETESRNLGWKKPEDAVGGQIIIPAYSDKKPFTVSGVIADFHFGSMRQRIMPEIVMNVNYTHSYRYFSIKVKQADLQGSIVALHAKWLQLMPDAPFEYHFLDDALTKLYTTEIQLKEAAKIATFLAIFIVLIGVLGLISLSVQKRTKEISIRKVLGSSAIRITALFLKDFLSVVFIAGIIACPLAYLIMQKWLNDYAYKVSLSFSPFAIPVLLLALMITLIIIIQTLKAALTKPITHLRTE